MGLRKKGFFFTLDAFFAVVLLVTGMILLSKFTFQEINTEQIDTISKDVLVAFSELKVGNINNSWIQNEINSSSITSVDNSILEQIGEYWATGELAKAEYLAQLMSANLIPSKYGFSIVIDGTTIYNRTISKTRDLVSAQRMVSGIAAGSPIEGSSSSAYLRKIRSKMTSSYAYFGGFIGQGNISVLSEPLPIDITGGNIFEMKLELDVADDFYLYINDDICNSSNITSLFTPSTANMTPDIWDITTCKSYVNPGRNNFSIIFQDFTNNSYVAGGYLKVNYNTNETVSNFTYGIKKYDFPEINGIVNLYDSFYIPGTLNSMKIYLHYFFNHTNNSEVSTYLTIGSVPVLNDTTSTSEQIILLNDSDISSLLNYSFLSNKTVPLRMSSYKQVLEEFITGGNADVILITDMSGSMKKSIYDNTDQGSAAIDCDDLGANPNARKTALAKCLDKKFVNIVMNYSGNRVWPIQIYNDQINAMDAPRNWSDASDVADEINSYNANNGLGKTCLACAVNKAYELLEQYGDPLKQNFIVLMTDGVPTHCADGSCTSNSSTYGALECDGYCDVPGLNCGVPEGCNDDSCSAAENNTLYSANRVINEFNTTIYTIGFGLISECSKAMTLLDTIANMTNGTFQNSSNVTILETIYGDIAYDVLEKSTQYSQKVVINSSVERSILYDDSYIEFNYTPAFADIKPDEISVNFQSDQFGSCNASVNLSEGARFFDARVTSYSAEHWTDLLTVNGIVVYNLSDYLINYSVDYVRLGDPYTIEIPVDLLVNGLNNISIRTADSPTNSTGCSNNNSLIYRVMVNYSSSRSGVVENSEGCDWLLEFEDGTFSNVSVPSSYAGIKECNFTNSSIYYDSVDAYDIAAYGIFNALDFDDDGRLLFNFVSEDLEIFVNVVTGIPYLWGPAIVEARVWQ